MIIFKSALSTLLVLTLPLAARAHIALWDEAMFGWNDDPNQVEPAYPLADMSFDDWWLHGTAYRNTPPKEGKFMELPSGGTYHGYTSCNKQQSKYGTVASERDATIYACKSSTSNPADGRGAMHTIDTWGDSNPKNVKGTSIAIAYESDINKVTPEQFAVISVNYTSPWFQQTDYRIPGDLPACPSGGCLCMWSWIHSIEGGSEQIYQLAYRCKVTGATGTRAIPAPQIARKCHFPEDTSNCTVGAKQPHYWLQKERNNNHQDYYDPPFYNGEYGFSDGAQSDLFASLPPVKTVSSMMTSSSVAHATPSSSVVSATTSSTATSEAATSVTDTPAVPDATYTVTVYRSTASSSVRPSIVSTKFSTTSPAANATFTTTSSATVAPNTTVAATSSATTTGKTCRRMRRRGTLVRRRSKSANIKPAPEKRMYGRPAIPEMRIGVGMPAVEPSDVEPARRGAQEAAGLENMQQTRELRVRKLRGGQSVKFW